MLIPVAPSEGEDLWWDENWSFRQEIILPINTDNQHAHYQPIDIRIEFNNSCWAKNEKEHSVRVIFQDGGIIKELESQIYNLNHTDSDHIDACSLVFLIPEEANGKEKYYVYYDDEEKPGPDYSDRVAIDESYYSYVPLKGFLFESWYYEITEGDYIVYAVAYQGKVIYAGQEQPVCQQVTKLRSGAEGSEPKEGELAASFNFIYWYKTEKEWVLPPISADQLVSKQIFVDGNLMVKFGIVSISHDGHIQTTAIYKYYYCPAEDKRIYTHVKNEILSYPFPTHKKIDVIYVTLKCGVFRSSASEFLNFGKIPSYLHVYGREERVLTYELNPYPKGSKQVIDSGHDWDLGSHAWVSVDNGESDKAHAVIFGSTDIVKSGADERQGIEIQQDEIELGEGVLGLYIGNTNTYIGRNSSEAGAGDAPDEELPEDFIVEFDAEFFTTENGGYKTVDEEAKMYQSLVKYQPTQEADMTNDEEKEENKYSLTTLVHLAPSFPMGSALSLATGKNLSYISVELYCDKEYRASETCERLPLKKFPDSTELIEIIKQIPDIFDFKNLSFFKKIRFQDLSPGRYLVKVWRENSLFGNRREFIGLQIINLQKDTETHIYCRPEGRISVSVLDQHDSGVENAEIYLMKDDMIVAEGQSDADGKAAVGAPCSFRDKYTLKTVYNGFQVHEEQVQLGYIRRVFPLKRTVSFEVYDLTIKIRDARGQAPVFDVNMELTSDEMEYPIFIPAENVGNGEFIFNDLYSATHVLTIKYKSFTVEETVSVPDIEVFNVEVYDLKISINDTLGLSPGVNLDVVLSNNELKKPVVIGAECNSNGEYLFFDIYPADYSLKIRYRTYTMIEKIRIPENNGILSLVFPAEYNVTATFLDLRGAHLENGMVNISRDGKEIKRPIDENGQISILLPPGVYNCKVYSNGQLVGKRRVNVISETDLKIVTNVEPIYPMIIIVSSVIFVIVAGFFMFKKKDFVPFLKILIVVLAVIAVISPWWSVYAHDSDIETSTKLFLIPFETITMTYTSDVVAGEVGTLPTDYTSSPVGLVLPAMILGCLCIIGSVLLRQFVKKRFPAFLVFLSGEACFVFSAVAFYLGTTNLAEVGFGSLFGSGTLSLNIPGEEIYATLECCWGLDIGYYLVLSAVVPSLIVFVCYVKEMLLNRSWRFFRFHR